MDHPKVTFIFDTKRDVSTFFCFAEDAHYDGGQSLEWAVFQKYPFFRKMFDGSTFTGTRDYVEDFVRKQYQKDGGAIRKNLFLYEQNWCVTESIFYALTDELFPSLPWPEGKYAAYPTIWGMFPRFLDSKTFQVPSRWRNKKYVNVIVAHEMLHFIFYEYFWRRYPQFADDEHDMLGWHVSEIFNTVVQNSPAWLKVFGLESIGYPEHEAIVKRLSREYHFGKTKTDFLVERILSEARKLCGQ
jgi:hypothetical protein